MGLNPVIRIAWGYDFLVAEDQEGLWVLGCISHGLSSSLRPTLVKAEGRSAGPLRSMAAHATGVILIDYQGFVFSSGNNSYGALLGHITPSARRKHSSLMLSASCGFSGSGAVNMLRFWINHLRSSGVWRGTVLCRRSIKAQFSQSGPCCCHPQGKLRKYKFCPLFPFTRDFHHLSTPDCSFFDLQAASIERREFTPAINKPRPLAFGRA